MAPLLQAALLASLLSQDPLEDGLHYRISVARLAQRTAGFHPIAPDYG